MLHISMIKNDFQVLIFLKLAGRKLGNILLEIFFHIENFDMFRCKQMLWLEPVVTHL